MLVDELPRIQQRVLGRTAGARASLPRKEQLECGRVERQGRNDGHAIVRTHVVSLDEKVQERKKIGMGNHHAFRRPRASGGEHDVRDRIRGCDAGWKRDTPLQLSRADKLVLREFSSEFGDVLEVGQENDQFVPDRFEDFVDLPERFLVDDDRPAAGLPQHQSGSFGRIFRIQRDVSITPEKRRDDSRERRS